jgi:hypothetical protein
MELGVGAKINLGEQKIESSGFLHGATAAAHTQHADS